MDSTVNNSSQIDGIITTELRQINDQRGAVLHMLRCDALGFVRFGECYFSEVLPSAIKAWKRHRVQSQNLAVPVGRIRLVIYDDQESSPMVCRSYADPVTTLETNTMGMVNLLQFERNMGV